MAQSVTRWAIRLVVLFAAILLAVAGFTMVKDKGLLSLFGIDSEGEDTQVIQAVTRTQEVSLLSLAVQGLSQQKENADVLGIDVPGTGRVVIVKYDFNAKLGIDGEKVSVNKSGENTYAITIPEFMVIGYSEPNFEVAVDDGGILGWVSPDIDKFEMVNAVFNDAAQVAYLEQHEDELEDQAKVFYDTLITSIDPGATTTFEFED
jgi:hypothetical protein